MKYRSRIWSNVLKDASWLCTNNKDHVLSSFRHYLRRSRKAHEPGIVLRFDGQIAFPASRTRSF